MNGDSPHVSDPNDVVTWPSGYAMRPEGLMRLATGANQKDVRVSAPFQLAAMTRAADGTSWGIQLKFRDTDGVPKSVVIPGVDLVGDGSAAIRRLVSLGLVVGDAKDLSDVLGQVLTPNRAQLGTYFDGINSKGTGQ